MNGSGFLLSVLVCLLPTLAFHGTRSTPPPELPSVVVEPVGKGTVVLSAANATSNLSVFHDLPERVPARQLPGWLDPLDQRPLTTFFGISDAGLNTFLGRHWPPLHLATIRDKAAGKETRLF